MVVDIQSDLYTMPASGGKATRITKLARTAALPDWSPRGKYITFQPYTDN